jgi:hypothetical protein
MSSHRLVWRSPLPDEGAGFPAWIRALKGKSGAYSIRDRRTRTVLYVGESHTGRLYQTLTRHLQQWNGFGSGPSYGRAGVQVAVRVLDRQHAEHEQFTLIARLRPRDNQQDGHSLYERRHDDDLSDIPF